ncbi:MAG: hypothetical protein BGO12_05960 [Verrucomicrobia bacterium 61-8]|nr:hypothetical protein [Verrucomicrobiota bacterium]OJV02186.1 MAG: hypothetical protein BGO12_05960 [Verrucomicrobia bacterium 61-8]
MSDLVSQLMASLAAGVVTKFADLPPEQIEALTAEFSRGTFTNEQRSVMAGLVSVATGKDVQLDEFNASSPVHKINPVALADGTPVLPVSLLTWAGRGQGFSGARDLLLSMPVRQVTAADWPTSEETP